MGKVPADALLRKAALPAGASLEVGIRRVVQAFFEGPRMLLLEPGGAQFVAIMVREAHDPSSASRGLLRKFIRPNARKIQAEFSRLLPGLDSRALDAGFEMMVSALRIVIERGPATRGRPPAAADVERLFGVLTEFVVGGWLRLVSRSS
jgi:hypothetical protein